MHIYPQDDAKSDMLEAELWPTLPDSYTSCPNIAITNLESYLQPEANINIFSDISIRITGISISHP